MSVRTSSTRSRSTIHDSRSTIACCLFSTAYCLLSTVYFAQADSPSDAGKVEFFERNIRPILANSCFSCHGPEKQKAGLRLDSRAALLAGGDNGPVIVPGKAQASMLIK